MSDFSEKPVFGQPIETGRTLKPQVKGQRKIGLENQLPPAIPREVSKDVARRRRLSQTRKYEAQKTDWDEFVLNEGTADSIKMKGRYYEIDLNLNIEPLGLFNTPPRTGSAKKLGELRGGEVVFVIKDSEKADDRFRKGWAEVIVMEPLQPGKKPKERIFNDGSINRIKCRVWHQGIIERQVLK